MTYDIAKAIEKDCAADDCPSDRVVMPAAHDNAVTLYAIPMMVSTQKEPLDKYCFGSCGKISLGGAIEIDEVGPCWVCTEKHCPLENRRIDMHLLIGFIICLAMALINFPFVLQEGGSTINLISMIFCAALALFQLIMAAVTIGR